MPFKEFHFPDEENFLMRLKASQEVHRELYSNGPLLCNPRGYIDNSIGEARETYRDWYYDEKKISAEFKFLPWLQRFNGIIPSQWISWFEICNDLDYASLKNVQLWPFLIEACIVHPENYVQRILADTQLLSNSQLVRLLSRDKGEGYDPAWILNDQNRLRVELGNPPFIVKLPLIP